MIDKRVMVRPDGYCVSAWGEYKIPAEIGIVAMEDPVGGFPPVFAKVCPENAEFWRWLSEQEAAAHD